MNEFTEKESGSKSEVLVSLLLDLANKNLSLTREIERATEGDGSAAARAYRVAGTAESWRDRVARHQKGDLVSVAGQLQVNQWTGQDGSTQSGYALVADSVISARTAKPGGKAGQQGQATDALRRAQEQHPLEDYDQTPPDDEIPF